MEGNTFEVGFFFLTFFFLLLFIVALRLVARGAIMFSPCSGCHGNKRRYGRFMMTKLHVDGVNQEVRSAEHPSPKYNQRGRRLLSSSPEIEFPHLCSIQQWIVRLSIITLNFLFCIPGLT